MEGNTPEPVADEAGAPAGEEEEPTDAPIQSEEDATAVVGKATEDTKETTKEAAEALKIENVSHHAVKVSLDAAEIGIPFPQMDVQIQKAE